MLMFCMLLSQIVMIIMPLISDSVAIRCAKFVYRFQAPHACMISFVANYLQTV